MSILCQSTIEVIIYSRSSIIFTLDISTVRCFFYPASLLRLCWSTRCCATARDHITQARLTVDRSTALEILRYVNGVFGIGEQTSVSPVHYPFLYNIIYKLHSDGNTSSHAIAQRIQYSPANFLHYTTHLFHHAHRNALRTQRTPFG